MLIATSVRAYARAANPESLRVRSLGLLLLAPALLFGGVIFELLDGPSSEWLLKVAGKNPTLCLIAIPCLSIAPLIGLLLGQRHGAPASPTLAGALTGLLAGSLGAAVYILRCTDDSPLFVAIWYMTAILIVTGAGGVIGRKLLCW